MPSTGAVTAGQHVGDRGNREKGGGGAQRAEDSPPPHSCGRTEVRGLRLLGKV